MEESFLYHYTSIENLALILKNKTIRFKPLNTLDDLLEGICGDGFELRKSVFVSCWTGIERESIPFWNMYTPQMSGVRIRMPKRMFTDRSVIIDHPNLTGSIQNSILKEEDHIKPDYFILPTHNNYLQEVRYTDKEDLLFPKILHSDVNEITVNYGSIGLYKKTEWKFQKEWRYIIRVFPRKLDSMSKKIDLFEEIQEGINHKMDVPMPFLDVSISEDAFKDMSIMLGPKATGAQRIIVESLISQYNSTIKIEESQIKVR
jgi:hypothetical protein